MSKIIIGICIVALVLTGSFWIVSATRRSANSQDRTPSNVEGNSEEEAIESNERYTREEVAQHNDESDCWLVIDERVYDVTDFISQHPGGDEILRGCGKDATTLFKTRTTDDGEQVGSGSPHSDAAESILEAYEIGQVSD